MLPPPRLGDDLGADQQTDFDADARKADAGTARLRAGRDVVVARQLTSAHPGTVVHDGERGLRGVRGDRNDRRAGVQRIGNDLREDGFLGGPGVGVAQVLEEVKEIDSRLAHAQILA
jgi:hypothetical protein